MQFDAWKSGCTIIFNARHYNTQRCSDQGQEAFIDVTAITYLVTAYDSIINQVPATVQLLNENYTNIREENSTESYYKG